VTHTLAVIRNVDKGNQEVLTCHFNPKEYGVTKSNDWSTNPVTGTALSKYEFKNGNPQKMTLQLMFDTFEKGLDVREVYTDKMWKLMDIDESLKDDHGKTGRPPRVLFQWGQAFGFVAIIKSITQKFVLFKEDGIPVRATLDVEFQQIQDTNLRPPQNPTSGGIGGSREWVVKEGDTLGSIAYAEYGDTSMWRAIADANRLTQVRRLRAGMLLEIPGLA
jgi:Contractile injection system tube protein/LysM domain